MKTIFHVADIATINGGKITRGVVYLSVHALSMRKDTTRIKSRLIVHTFVNVY